MNSFKDRMLCLVREHAKAIGAFVATAGTYAVAHFGLKLPADFTLLATTIVPTLVVYAIPNTVCDEVDA